MSEQGDRLESDLHNVLRDYPQAPLPPIFQTAVLARIAATPQQPASATAASYAGESTAGGFLEMSSALVMGMILGALLLLVLLVGNPLIDAGLFPLPLTLDMQSLPWGWISAAMVVAVVELVMVILAGLHLTDS